MKSVIRNGLIATTIALAIMAGVMIWAYQTLPDGQIPLHWNAAGDVDRWGSRTEALWALAILPIVTLFTGALLAVVPALDPRKINLEKSAKVYAVVWISTMALMTALHVGIAQMSISGANGGEANAIEFVRFVIAGTGILFVLLGNYLPKTRPNWFLGISTPWTLSSDDTWEKTHRVGGRLFMVVGFLSIIAAFVFNGLTLALIMPAMTISVALFCVIYSYFVWRGATDKHLGTEQIV